MSAFTRWAFRSLAIAACTTAAASAASGQVIIQPKANPGGGQAPRVELPKRLPLKNPFAPIPIQSAQLPANQKKPSILAMPSINSLPGIPMSSIQGQSIPALWNPAGSNPWMNQVNTMPFPVYPFAINPVANPRFVNPLLVNPLQNPLVMNPWDNPLLVNPLLANSLVLNPFLVNRPINFPFGVPNRIVGGNGPSNPYGSQSTITSSVADQDSGTMMDNGPDFQVNNTTRTVYQPISGVVTLADGSTFYRAPGSGNSTPIGNYATGNDFYHNPIGGTFFNPRSGTLGKPGQTNVFMPYVW